VLGGEVSAAAVADLMAAMIDAEPLAERDYVEVVDAATLAPLDRLEAGTEVRLLAAARFGVPRLLDNVGVVVPGS
jgi:pantoate--beta-alanine ligase